MSKYQSDEWERGHNALLLAEWRRQKGEDLVPQVNQYAEAIYALTIQMGGQPVRCVAILAEAMQYCCYGGMDGYLADMDRRDALCDEPPQSALRDRIAEIRRYLEA